MNSMILRNYISAIQLINTVFEQVLTSARSERHIFPFTELTPVGTACTEDMFRCNNGSCLNKTRVCDLTKDCTDGEDEEADCRNCQIATFPCRAQFVEFVTVYNRRTFQTKYRRTPGVISRTDGADGGTYLEDR